MHHKNWSLSDYLTKYCSSSRSFRSEGKQLRLPAWTWRDTADERFSNLWNFLSLMPRKKLLSCFSSVPGKSAPHSHPHGCGVAHHGRTGSCCLAHAGTPVPSGLIFSTMGCRLWLPLGCPLPSTLQRPLSYPKPASPSQLGTRCWSSPLALFVILSPKKSAIP